MSKTHTHFNSVKAGVDLSEGVPIAEWEKMCGSKVRYYSKRAAKTALNAFQRVRGRHGRPEFLRAYPCPWCHGWHLTKGKEKQIKTQNSKFKISP